MTTQLTQGTQLSVGCVLCHQPAAGLDPRGVGVRAWCWPSSGMGVVGSCLSGRGISNPLSRLAPVSSLYSWVL